MEDQSKKNIYFPNYQASAQKSLKDKDFSKWFDFHQEHLTLQRLYPAQGLAELFAAELPIETFPEKIKNGVYLSDISLINSPIEKFKQLINSFESIKDILPESEICLFTNQNDLLQWEKYWSKNFSKKFAKQNQHYSFEAISHFSSALKLNLNGLSSIHLISFLLQKFIQYCDDLNSQTNQFSDKITPFKFLYFPNTNIIEETALFLSIRYCAEEIIRQYPFYSEKKQQNQLKDFFQIWSLPSNRILLPTSVEENMLRQMYAILASILGGADVILNSLPLPLDLQKSISLEDHLHFYRYSSLLLPLIISEGALPVGQRVDQGNFLIQNLVAQNSQYLWSNVVQFGATNISDFSVWLKQADQDAQNYQNELANNKIKKVGLNIFKDKIMGSPFTAYFNN